MLTRAPVSRDRVSLRGRRAIVARRCLGVRRFAVASQRVGGTHPVVFQGGRLGYVKGSRCGLVRLGGGSRGGWRYWMDIRLNGGLEEASDSLASR